MEGSIPLSTSSIIHDRILCSDLSKGQAPNAVRCINNLDNRAPPSYIHVESCVDTPDFVNYFDQLLLHQALNNNLDCVPDACNCIGTCNTECVCHSKYIDEEGRLIEPVYSNEFVTSCSDKCSCNPQKCPYQLTEQYNRREFDVYMAGPSIGYGLKTRAHIPFGSYVMEYAGERITVNEKDARPDDTYFYDASFAGITVNVDSRFKGNHSRFINHSCVPNLWPVTVLKSGYKSEPSNVAFFAVDDIEADSTLGIDYGKTYWYVKSSLRPPNNRDDGQAPIYCECFSTNCKFSKELYPYLMCYYRRFHPADYKQLKDNGFSLAIIDELPFDYGVDYDYLYKSLDDDDEIEQM